MKIRCAEPMEGRRERLCKSDEAKVSKVFTKEGRLLVERLQLFSRDSEVYKDTGGSFILSDAQYHAHMIPASVPSYHLYKYLALRIAKSLLPENFLDCSEIRFFRESGERAAVTYSGFVPDDNGVIERRSEVMARFYASNDKQARESIKEVADRVERELNPDIVLISARAESLGLMVPHPEANYHLSSGATVFFEVGGINMSRAVMASLEADNQDALRCLAMIYSVYVRGYSDRAMKDPGRFSPPLPGLYKSYHEQDFERIFAVMHGFLISGRYGMPLGLAEVMKSRFRDWEYLTECRMVRKQLSEENLRLPEGLGQTIDRILRDEY